MKFKVRKAKIKDIPELERHIEVSARAIQKTYFTHEQIQVALGSAWTLDNQLALILDKTYWIVENSNEIIACGGWARPNTKNKTNKVKIYTFFVNPVHDWNNVVKLILRKCEGQAMSKGYDTFIVETTINGSDFYKSQGYIFESMSCKKLMVGLTNVVIKLQKNF